MVTSTGRVLGVVNCEPVSRYVEAGYSLSRLEGYYNPTSYFDWVHIFARGDTEWQISPRVHVHPLSHTSDFRAAVELLRQCVRYRVDVLRNFEAFGTHLLTAEVKRVLRLPAVLSLHDVLYPPSILEYDHIFTYVEWLKDAIIEKYNYRDVTVLLNRVDEDLFRPQPPTRVPGEYFAFVNRIVSIGRLADSYKNHSTMIRAMEHVLRTHPNTLLLILGDGVDRQAYAELISTLGLDNNVRLLGNLPQEQVAEYLNWCDFLALCNPYGDLGIPFAEALMVGKPVVATGGKGNAYLHLEDGFNARMVPYEEIYTPAAVACAVIHMIENKAHFDPAAIRRRAISEYGFEMLARREAAVYEELLERRKKPAPRSPVPRRPQAAGSRRLGYRTIARRAALYAARYLSLHARSHAPTGGAR